MKLAVVTGVARCSGIGHAICETLLSGGHAVIGLDVNPLEASSQLPSQFSTRFRFRACRVDSDPFTFNREIKAALDDIGHEYIDVVVNNAGISNPYMADGFAVNAETNEGDSLLLLKKRFKQFDSYIQNNLRSAFLVTEVCKQYFPPPMAKSSLSPPNASIIHISSTRALASEYGSAHSQEGYASAKAGLIGLTHSQGQSMEGRARVNVILPGWINTEDDFVPSEADHKWHAAGRVGLPKDVAELVAFLADDEKSGFITCQEFVIDGGATKRMYYP